MALKTLGRTLACGARKTNLHFSIASSLCVLTNCEPAGWPAGQLYIGTRALQNPPCSSICNRNVIPSVDDSFFGGKTARVCHMETDNHRRLKWTRMVSQGKTLGFQFMI